MGRCLAETFAKARRRSTTTRRERLDRAIAPPEAKYTYFTPPLPLQNHLVIKNKNRRHVFYFYLFFIHLPNPLNWGEPIVLPILLSLLLLFF